MAETTAMAIKTAMAVTVAQMATVMVMEMVTAATAVAAQKIAETQVAQQLTMAAMDALMVAATAAEPTRVLVRKTSSQTWLESVHASKTAEQDLTHPARLPKRAEQLAATEPAQDPQPAKQELL